MLDIIPDNFFRRFAHNEFLKFLDDHDAAVSHHRIRRCMGDNIFRRRFAAIHDVEVESPHFIGDELIDNSPHAFIHEKIFFANEQVQGAKTSAFGLFDEIVVAREL